MSRNSSLSRIKRLAGIRASKTTRNVVYEYVRTVHPMGFYPHILNLLAVALDELKKKESK